jgi:hypothetical protein
MAISEDELFRNGNTYRLHQDVLRWPLLGGYIAFFAGIIGLANKPDKWLGIGLAFVGVFYMFILAVENFFYNLFAEYVKDCEVRSDTNEKLRTLQQFSKEKAKQIGPFHHSFFFALLIVLFGNITIIQIYVCDQILAPLLHILNAAIFLLIFWGWRKLVFPYFVSHLQKIFDVPHK